MRERVSVIVCTRNRAEALESCLSSLLADASAVSRELVVVDNGSVDATRSVVEGVAARSPLPVRYAREETPGLSRARNLGVRLARGDLLLFTDDDVVVENGWADALAAPFEDPRVAGAGGRILPRWPFTPPAWMDGPHAVHLTLPDFGPKPRIFGRDESPIGANMAARTAVARAREPVFDPRLGHRAGRYDGCEETHFFRHVRASGEVVYTPNALIYHCIPAERIDWNMMRRAWFDGGMGLAREQRLRGEELPSLPRRAARALRTTARAVAVRRANRRLRQPGADEAWREFSAYSWAGMQLELLLGGAPRTAESISRVLLR